MFENLTCCFLNIQLTSIRLTNFTLFKNFPRPRLEEHRVRPIAVHLEDYDARTSSLSGLASWRPPVTSFTFSRCPSVCSFFSWSFKAIRPTKTEYGVKEIAVDLEASDPRTFSSLCLVSFLWGFPCLLLHSLDARVCAPSYPQEKL